MPPDPAFRLSTYLTLAAACACLGYAESETLPEVGAFAAAAVVGLAVIYRMETRVRLLSIPRANALGAAIAVAGLVWAGGRVAQEVRTNDHGSVGWPQFVVSLIAPVLMAAMLAKLLRREKHAGDYWYLHGAALGAVVFAGAMSGRPPAVALTTLYAACGVWSLSRFYLARSDGSVPPIPPRDPRAGTARGPLPTRGTPDPPRRLAGLGRAAGWVLLAAAVAAPVALLVPRSPYGRFDFGGRRMEIGYAGDQMIDLNRTGELGENDEVAFEVTAADAGGGAKDDLPPEQRWKGTVLTQYLNGNWRRDSPPVLPAVARTANRGGPWSPPDLGPGRYELRFAVPAKLRAQFLADPVAWAAGQPRPVADAGGGGPAGAWVTMGDGSFLRIAPAGLSAPVVRYVQYTRPPAEPDLGPGFVAADDVKRALVENPAAKVGEYAAALLNRLAAGGALPPGVLARDPVTRRVPAEYHEAVARAFRAHLADDPGFTYTTSLRRDDKALDPVEDFLLGTRAGHCERFATALVLMLRSQGVPAVLVLGFKGCEHAGGGRYEVRQEYAHAWAEALITRPAPAPPGRVWHWLSLDPTPARGPATTGDGPGADGEGALARAWAAARAGVVRFLMAMSPAERRGVLGDALARAARADVLAAAGGVVALILVVRAVRRRVTTRPVPRHPAATWFDRLPALLAGYGYAPAAGETPLAFAARVGDALRDRPAAAAVAGVPVEWAEAYYAARFGGHPLTPGRGAELGARLAALRSALETDQRAG